MRVAMTVTAALLLATLGRAEDQARPLIEKAIKAHGGTEALTKAQRAVRTAEGTLTSADVPTTFRDEITYDLPGRWRYDGTVGRTRLLLVVNKTGGWRATGGASTELAAKSLAELREEIHIAYLGTLVPLLKDDRFKLAEAGEEQVQDRKALGVTVQCEGHAEVRLWFDAETFLLVKASVPRAQRGGIGVKMEYLYLDHKEFDGVKRPTTQRDLLNGRKVSEVKISSYKFPAKLDDRLFTKP